MADKVIVSKEKLDKIADNVKSSTKTTKNLSLDEIAEIVKQGIGKSALITTNIPQGKTPVPAEGTFENIYMNTSLSVDEVNNLLFNALGPIETPYVVFTEENSMDLENVNDISDVNMAAVILFDQSSGGYIIAHPMILEGIDLLVFFNGTGTLQGYVDFKGWHPEFSHGILPLRTGVLTGSLMGMLPSGLSNDKLSNLFSIEPFASNIGMPIGTMDSSYVYFNLDLNIEKVKEIVALTQFRLGNTLYTKNDNLIIKQTQGNEEVLWSEENGWDPNFNGIVQIYDIDISSYNYSWAKDAVELISQTPYKCNTMTSIPVDGFVGNVHINTNLSISEIDSILAGLPFVEADDDYIPIPSSPNNYIVGIYIGDSLTHYYVPYIKDTDNDAYLAIAKFSDGYMIITTGRVPIYNSSRSYAENAVGDSDTPVESLLGFITGVSISLHTNNRSKEFYGFEQESNDLLAPLLSTTPFKIKPIVEVGEGTVVPTSGDIDKIYFNTFLSDEEMIQILSSLEYNELGVAALTTDGKAINFEQPEPGCQTIIVMNDGSVYIILPLETLLTNNPNDMYYAINQVPLDDGYTIPFLGWNPSFNGEVDIISPLVESVNINGIVTPSGSQNNKLTKLMSSAPFSTKEKELQKGTIVPNEGTVEKIYFNKNTSLEEVRAMLSQLTYTVDDEDHAYTMVCNEDESVTIAAMMDGAYIADIAILRKIFDGELPETEFANAIYWIDDNEEVNTFDFVGWNPNFSGEVQITGTLKRYMETGYENGAENKLLTPIISTTPFKTVNRPVPNNTYVEKVYFNTSSTIEEIQSLITAIWENEFEGRDQDSGYTLFKNEDGSIHYTISPLGLAGIGDFNAVSDVVIKMMNGEIGEAEAMALLLEAMIWAADGKSMGWETGWNPNFNGVVEVNSNLVDTHSEIEWPYGGFNDQLVNLLSIDPYAEAESDVELEGTYDGRAISITENGELNLRSLITKEKKIPLKINVDVISKESVIISQVNDIQISEYGYLTWTAADTTNLEVYAPYTVSYLVNVNGTEFETSDTQLLVLDYIVEGENSITVTTQTTITVTKTQDHESEILDQVVLWSKPKEAIIVKSSAYLDYSMCYTSAVDIDGKAYIFGGQATGRNLDTIYCYDPTTDTRTTKSVKLFETIYGTSAVAIDSKAYIFGGYGSGSEEYIQCYDPTTDTRTTKGAELGSKMYHTSAVAIDGKAYIFGGYYTSCFSWIQCYDPTTDTRTTKSTYLITPICRTSAVAIDGKAYIFGGNDYSGSTYYNDIQCYDPTTETCTTKSVTLTAKMSDTSAVAIDGKAYIFGGNSSAYKYIQCYEPKDDIIIVENATLIEGYKGTSAVAIDDRAYIFSGSGYASIQIMILG